MLVNINSMADKNAGVYGMYIPSTDTSEMVEVILYSKFHAPHKHHTRTSQIPNKFHTNATQTTLKYHTNTKQTPHKLHTRTSQVAHKCHTNATQTTHKLHAQMQRTHALDTHDMLFTLTPHNQPNIFFWTNISSL